MANGVDDQTAFAPGAFPSLKNAIRYDGVLNRRHKTLFRLSVVSGQYKGKHIQSS
jgi:hypothetical protein